MRSSAPLRSRFTVFSLFILSVILSLVFVFSATALATNVSGTISQNTTWTTGGSPYVLTGNVTIASGVTLTIESGVVVKPQSTSYGLTVYGTLNATGAVFTSYKDDSHGGDTNGDGGVTSPAPGNWKYVYFNGGNGSLSGCTVLYGGYYDGGEINIGSNSSPTISGNTISFSKKSGISVASGCAPIITNNTINDNQGLYGVDFYTNSPVSFSGNNIINNPNAQAVRLSATLGQGKVFNNSYSGNKQDAMLLVGQVTATTDWPASNSPYWVQLPYVSGNSALNIGSGSIVKFEAVGRSMFIFAGSTLNADGVIFTSDRDDAHGGDTNGDGNATQPAPGDWGEISFSGGGGSISNSTILYGGNGGFYDYCEICISGGSSPIINNNVISQSIKSGIYVSSGSPSIHNNDIFTNANGYYGLYSDVDIDATNNWWGGVGGPKPYGTGNAVNSHVTADPWSDVPFTQSGAEAESMGTDTWCGAYGEPVNTSTGAFTYSHTDINIPTKGVPLEFSRTYNSNDSNDGLLGYGWSFSWQMSANPRANGDVIMLKGDGRRDTFIKNPDNSYSAPSGRHDSLVKNGDGTYKLTTQDQITYNFGTNNRLSSAVSETGQTTSFTYDSNKRLTAITEPEGRTLSFTYTLENRIDEITDPQGNTVSFGYSTDGDLTQITDQNGGISKYAYDEHRITSITDPNASALEPDGPAFVNNTYENGKVVQQTDAEGNMITFAYDPANGRTTMTRVMDPDDPSQNQVTVHEFDSQLRLTKETDPYGKETTYSYDASGNRDSVTDRRGINIRTIFDTSGNVTDLYKAYGLPEQQHTQITYNSKNHPTTKSDSRGFTTSYAYDASQTFLQQISYPQVTNYDGTTSSFTESWRRALFSAPFTPRLKSESLVAFGF